MTFDELVRKVAEKNEMYTADGRPRLSKVDAIIRDALKLAADATNNGGAPVFPGIGRFVKVTVRSTGRRPDGSVWTTPGRTKLALRASVHQGGRSRPTSKTSATTATTAAA